MYFCLHCSNTGFVRAQNKQRASLCLVIYVHFSKYFNSPAVVWVHISHMFHSFYFYIYFCTDLDERGISPPCPGASTLKPWKMLRWKVRMAKIYPCLLSAQFRTFKENQSKQLMVVLLWTASAYFEWRYLYVTLTPLNIFRIYCSGSHGPVLLLLHGGGHSALSWAVFTVSIIPI